MQSTMKSGFGEEKSGDRNEPTSMIWMSHEKGAQVVCIYKSSVSYFKNKRVWVKTPSPRNKTHLVVSLFWQSFICVTKPQSCGEVLLSSFIPVNSCQGFILGMCLWGFASGRDPDNAWEGDWYGHPILLMVRESHSPTTLEMVLKPR